MYMRYAGNGIGHYRVQTNDYHEVARVDEESQDEDVPVADVLSLSDNETNGSETDDQDSDGEEDEVDPDDLAEDGEGGFIEAEDEEGYAPL